MGCLDAADDAETLADKMRISQHKHFNSELAFGAEHLRGVKMQAAKVPFCRLNVTTP